MPKPLIKLLATFFHLGDLPVASGTLASLAGVLIYFIVYENPLLSAAVILLVTVLGFCVSAEAEKMFGQKDPSRIVIDEVAGILIAFFMIPIHQTSVVVTTFFLFHAFDMFKIYPVNKLEGVGGSAGIMGDDIIAGIYANVTMHLAIRLAGLV